MQSWPLATPRATGIHDVAPAPDGGVWFTAQRSGHLLGEHQAERRIELVEVAKRLDARVVLGNARAVSKPGLARIAGARGDFREAVTHGRL